MVYDIDSMRVGELIGVYNKRLKIEVVRNGLTWITDVRDRNKWLKESLKHNESIVTVEIDPKTKYETLLCMMTSYGWSADTINSIFEYITGIKINLIDLNCNRCNTRLQWTEAATADGIYCCPDCKKRNVKATVLPKMEA